MCLFQPPLTSPQLIASKSSSSFSDGPVPFLPMSVFLEDRKLSNNLSPSGDNDGCRSARTAVQVRAGSFFFILTIPFKEFSKLLFPLLSRRYVVAFLPAR